MTGSGSDGSRARSFSELVDAAVSEHSESARQYAAESAYAAQRRLELAEHVMRVIEPILTEGVAALRRLGVRASTMSYSRPGPRHGVFSGSPQFGRVGGVQIYGGWRKASGLAAEELTGQYYASVGYRPGLQQGWTLTAVDYGAAPPTTPAYLMLEENLRSWAFNYDEGRVCVVMAGQPRCYVDIQIDEEIPGALTPLTFRPDVLRLGLADSIGRLAASS